MNNDESVSDFTGEDHFPNQLEQTSVVIWGLGLMGGSLAMALHGKTRWLAGVDADEEVCSQALSMGIVDSASTDAGELIPRADLIVLAVPLDLIPDFLRRLPVLTDRPAVVLDLGSTKANVLVAMQELPDRFAVIGGHPMCGKEVNSLQNASQSLYQKASFALLSLERTPDSARGLVESLVKAVGSVPIWMDAKTHDRWAAAISHLPYLAANALAAVIPVEAAPLVGPGYLSTTRLASESERMMMDILANNKENIMPILTAYRKQIEKIENALIKDDHEQLQSLFHDGLECHEGVLEGYRKVTGV
jgi:prephenate dehydrogenase